MSATTNGVVVENDKGFDPSKIDKTVLEIHIAALKPAQPTTATKLEARARDLISHYKRTTPAESLFPCSNCNGASPESLDQCPFCGFADDANSADDDSAVSRPEPKTGQLVKVQRASLVSGRPDVSRLDAEVSRIHKLKAAGALALWELGASLNRMKADGLWQLRLNDTGSKMRWKNFESFCHAEIQMSPTNAKELMKVAAAYPREMVAEFGTKKLMLALNAPPEERKRIETEIRAGASKREIEKKVRVANAGRETVVRSDTGKEVRKGGGQVAQPAETRVDTGDAKERKAEPAARITVANILGVQKVKLFKKASMNMREPDPKAGTRAKKVLDTPWGYLDLANGVRMEMTVQQNGAGELEIKVQTKRVSADD